MLENAEAGLSSNFLTALAELSPPGGRGALEIGFSWSYARPVPDVPGRAFRFGDTLFAPLAEAARVLRETSPVPGYEIEGYIVRLERVPADVSTPGTVVLATTLEDRPGASEIHVTLNAGVYEAAVEAYVAGARVRITGTLTRAGRKLTLENPGGLVVLPEGD